MLNEQTVNNNVEQGIASYVDYLNNLRLIDLMNALDSILISETDKLADLATKSDNALSQLDWAKTEIDNLIDTNRGGATGLHGFISEFAETGIRNARDVYQNMQKSVVLLNDNGPVDILLQGEKVQMKFYANIQEEIKQAANYDKMSMIFPKDHVEVIEKIMSGAKEVELNGNTLSEAQINSVKKLVEDESNLRGVTYDKWLKPSVLEYKDVQKEEINRTLSREVRKIKKKTVQQKSDIKKEADSDRLNAQKKAQPSFGEASKAAGIGSAIQGGLNLGIFIYRKHKEGKEVWDFDYEDWKECGITTAEGAIKGGISGYAIYGLTNICHLAAPSAGAITSGTFGLANAIIKYRKGEVDSEGFIDLVTLNAIDATGAAIGAAIGQAVIPVPVVGALIGSIAATTALGLGKGALNKREIEVISQYQEKNKAFIDNLDQNYQVILNELLNEYNKLGELQQYSFDYNINVELRFGSSIKLAKSVGVPEHSILKSEQEIEDFFIN